MESAKLRAAADQAAGAGPPSRSGEDELPVFDRDGMLRRLMDDHDLVSTIMDVFLEDLPQQIETLKCLLERGDASGVGSTAHSIKGAAGNVGGERLRRSALAIEKAADAGDLRSAAGCLADLELQFACLKEAMEQHANG